MNGFVTPDEDTTERTALAYHFLVGALEGFSESISGELPRRVQAISLRLFTRTMKSELEQFIRTGDQSGLNNPELFGKLGSFDIQLEISKDPSLLEDDKPSGPHVAVRRSGPNLVAVLAAFLAGVALTLLLT